MPNIKSAKKRTKVIAAKTLKNQMFKTSLKTTIKKYEAAVAAGDKTVIWQSFKDAVKKIEEAYNDGV